MVTCSVDLFLRGRGGSEGVVTPNFVTIINQNHNNARLINL